MFVLEVEEERIGCMGFRVQDELVDIYNVILGNKEYGGMGLMGRALAAMIRFIRTQYSLPITAKVLKGNSAIRWYLDNGFVIIVSHNRYDVIQFIGTDGG